MTRDPWSRGFPGQPMQLSLELLPVQARWVRDLRPSVPCRARRSRDGGRCQNWAMRGSAVCHAHGGRAGQVRRAAEQRLIDAATEALAARACRRLGIWPRADAQAWTAAALRTLGMAPDAS
jgi:hypothetical protein